MSKIIKSREVRVTGYDPFERETLFTFGPSGSAELSVDNGHEENPPDPAEVLAAARQEAEEKVKEAYAQGYRRGEEKGLEEFRAKVDGASKVLELAAIEIQRKRSEFINSLEPQVVRIAEMVAERILHRECREDSELIHATVRSALELIVDRAELSVTLHPNDQETLRNNKADLLETFDGIERLRIVTDEKVARGGCIVESDEVVIDATLESQLQQLLDALRE